MLQISPPFDPPSPFDDADCGQPRDIMYLVLATAVVLSSENARGLLQDTFAHLSVVFYDHQATVLIGLAVAFVASLLLSARRKVRADAPAPRSRDNRLQGPEKPVQRPSAEAPRRKGGGIRSSGTANGNAAGGSPWLALWRARKALFGRIWWEHLCVFNGVDDSSSHECERCAHGRRFRTYWERPAPPPWLWRPPARVVSQLDGDIPSHYCHTRLQATTDYTAAPSLMAINRNVSEVGSKAQKYEASHDVGGGTVDQRKKGYTDMVNQYYDLSTDFYEYGWGESFHFAARAATESFGESLARHEFYLGSRLGLEKGMRALDVGCGVGGPARNIARFTGAEIVGINNNDYQIARGNAKNVRQGLAGQVSFQKGDFMHMPFEDASFDRVYTIEATCHAPDRVGCFAEILRVLKPGGTFAGYEWVTTPKYDPNNAEHVAIKKGIEVGNGLPDVNPASHVIDSMRKAGFEVLEWADHAEPDARFPVPWYQPFEPSWHPRGWKTTKMGIFFTNMMVRLLECVRLAPKGSHKMHTHLATGARTLHAGGKAEIFTPMLFFLARKPE